MQQFSHKLQHTFTYYTSWNTKLLQYIHMTARTHTHMHTHIYYIIYIHKHALKEAIMNKHLHPTTV